MIDKIPGEQFVQNALAQYVEIRVQRRGFKGLGPVAPVLMRQQKNLGNPAVAAGQQPLDVRPAGDVGVDLHVGCFSQTVFDVLDFCFQGGLVIHGNPLKGSVRLGHKRAQAYGYLSDPFSSPARLEEAMLDFFAQAYNSFDILHGFRGKPDHEI